MTERITTAGIAIRDGRVLVGKRVKGGSLSEKWEFPGGKNRWGESIEDTLKREYDEELGVKVEVGNEIFQYDFVNKDTQYHLKACLVDVLFDDFRLLVHTDMKWVDAENLMDLPMGGSDNEIRSFLFAEHYI